GLGKADSLVSGRRQSAITSSLRRPRCSTRQAVQRMVPKIPAHPVDRWTSWTRPHAVGRLRDVPPHDVLWLGTPRCVTRPFLPYVAARKTSRRLFSRPSSAL